MVCREDQDHFLQVLWAISNCRSSGSTTGPSKGPAKGWAQPTAMQIQFVRSQLLGGLFYLILLSAWTVRYFVENKVAFFESFQGMHSTNDAVQYENSLQIIRQAKFHELHAASSELRELAKAPLGSKVDFATLEGAKSPSYFPRNLLNNYGERQMIFQEGQGHMLQALDGRVTAFRFSRNFFKHFHTFSNSIQEVQMVCQS